MSDMFVPPEAPRPSGTPSTSPPEPRHRGEPPPAEFEADSGYTWEADIPPDDEFTPDGRRVRHDAFTARRRHDFLRALARTGCLSDACRAVGVAPATVYRHQNEDAGFAAQCRAAIEMAAVPVEIAAWQRAVEGVDQQFACGGEVHVRRRYSDGLLRLLLQGSNPKKYGPNPGFSRKRLARWERKQMEREVRAELEARRDAKGLPDRSFEEAVESILTKIDAIERHEEPGKLAAGWTRSEDGVWIPPGYGPIPGWAPPASPAALPGPPDIAPDDPAAVGDQGAPAPLGEEGALPAQDGETPRDSV